jgi:RNA polymerase primary sigma factor
MTNRLTAGAERKLVDAYQHSRGRARPDFGARNALVEAHLPLIRATAKAIQSANQQHVDVQDLVQAGCVGMIEAIERFDASKGTRLSTYALFWIRNAMHQVVKQSRYDRYITDDIYRGLMKLNSALSKQPVRFDHSIDYESLARDSGFSVNHCQFLVAQSRPILSLELPLTKNGKLKLSDTLDDRCVISPEDCHKISTARGIVEDALNRTRLSRDERNAVDTFFFDDRPLFTSTRESKKSLRDAARYRCRKALALLRKSQMDRLQKAKTLFDSVGGR